MNAQKSRFIGTVFQIKVSVTLVPPLGRDINENYIEAKYVQECDFLRACMLEEFNIIT